MRAPGSCFAVSGRGDCKGNSVANGIPVARIALCNGISIAQTRDHLLTQFLLMFQACYGVLNIPDGDWFCDRCAAKAKDEPCVLCPVYEGAMKRTEQGYWCHCSCVWWIPEVHFKDPIAMRPVMGVPAVDRKRFSLKCMFCDTKNGKVPDSLNRSTSFVFVS